MSLTTRLAPDEIADHFARFTRHFLRYETTDVADVEILSPALGSQTAAGGVHLTGVTYEPKRGSLEIELEPGDVRAYSPREVWTVEDDDGFIRAIEIVLADGSREIVRIRRLGLTNAPARGGS
jgi:hypothetical protein